MIYHLPVLVWAIIILIAVCLPGNSLSQISFWDHIPGFDKMVHAALFFIFVLILARSVKQYKGVQKRYYQGIITLSAAGIYALITEMLQLFVVSGRSWEWLDLLFDLAGAAAGWMAYIMIMRKFAKAFGSFK